MYLGKIPQRKSVALKGIGNIVDKIKKSTETWICLEGNQTIFFFFLVGGLYCGLRKINTVVDL